MRAWWLVAALVALPAWAAPRPLFLETFDLGDGGWKPFGAEGATVTTQTAVARQGSALESRYRLDKDRRLHALVCEPKVSLKDARSIRFWLRTSQRATMIVLFQETDAGGKGRYATMFVSEPETWQRVELSVDRFRLTDDTTDADGKLDMDQIAGVGIGDMSGLLGGVQGDPDRRLWLDEVQVDGGDCATAYSATGRLPFVLDGFEQDFACWLPTVGKTERDKKQGHLVWTYGTEQPQGGIPGLISMVGPLPAKGARQLVLHWCSKRARQIAVLLTEEKRGTRPERRYYQLVDAPVGDKPETTALALSAFQLDKRDRPNDTKALELPNVSLLTLVDFSLVAKQADGENTIRLEEVLLSAD